jgi:membrane associated rhomboid family serine protease
MLDDRDYMRPPSFDRRWSLTTIILVVNAVVFVLQSVGDFYVRDFPLYKYFALSLAGLREGYLWQPVTFQFLHGGLWHLLGNLIVIYFFGRPIEQTLGPRRFLGIYFGSGMVGGLLQILASLVLRGRFGAAEVVGASAGAFGLVAAFATLYPERPLTLLLFFVIPFSMRAKFLLLFEVLLALFGIIFRVDNIAHVAHLGGIGMGVVLARWGTLAIWPRFLLGSVRPVRRPRELARVRLGAGTWPEPKPPAVHDLPPAEFISREVDPILDKISAHGFESLTPRERRILEAASAKIKRR